MGSRREVATWLSCSLIAALSVFAVLSLVGGLSGGLSPVRELKFWPGLTVGLAPGISRWWDVLAAAALGPFLLLALGGRAAKERESIAGLPKYATATFVAFLALGLAAGVSGLLIGVVAPAASGLLIGAIVGLVIGRPEGWKTVAIDGVDAGSVIAAGCGVGIGLTSSLTIGLAAALVAVPLVTLFYALGHCLTAAAKSAIDRRSGRRG